MANSFSYKETKTTTMKVVGIVDTDTMTITSEDAGERSLATLLSPFQGADVEIKIAVKIDTELDEPQA